MKRCTVLLISVALLAVAGAGRADVPSWHGPWPDTCLHVWTPDPGRVPGEAAATSPEYYIWSSFPALAPELYWLQVTVNGRPTTLGSDVIRVQGAYMIPAEAAKKLGLSVSYSPDNMIITITGKGHTLNSTLYASRATVDGFSQPVRVPSRWQRGTRYVSLDLLAQAFNLVVTEDQGQIRISAY